MEERNMRIAPDMLFGLLRRRLDEQTYRRVAAAAAKAVGRGGDAVVLRSSRLSRAALARAKESLSGSAGRGVTSG